MIPDILDRALVYEALVFAIRSNWGVGFHNGDQGYAFYSPKGDMGSRAKDSDGPDKNVLFMMVRELSREHGVAGSKSRPKIETWKDFCELAHGAYVKDCERERKGLPLMRKPD